MGNKILIAMSGGVDSSVAALILKKQGYDCMGANMRLYSNGAAGILSRTCCSLDDAQDARQVCGRLGIPFYVFNFKDDFRKEVISRFISCYENGVTPNPCIDCNRYIKYGRFLNRAKELGADTMATGHYARIERDAETGRYLLKKAADDGKDQSYVLAFMTQEQLAHTRFPLGNLTKTEVRKIAHENAFVNASKHDSQDICFIPDGNYAEFIRKHAETGTTPGEFVDEDGRILGRHGGIINYTIGQRKGLGIYSDRPYYVSRIIPEENVVVLTHDSDAGSVSLTACRLNFIAVPDITSPIRVKARIRYRHREQWATVSRTGDDEIKVVFDETQRAVTKGQAVVLYDGDNVVGAGTITGTA